MSPEKTNVAFNFKQFSIVQDNCVMKLNTDGVLLGAWCEVEGVKNVLDIGTGTGIIALMVAQRASRNAKITAVDIDEGACLDAKINVSNSPFLDNIEVVNAAVQDFAFAATQEYDLIISNPPFFTGGTFSANENKANVRHAIKLPHGELLSSVQKLLSPTGRFALILPYLEGLRMIELAERAHLVPVRITEVISKTDRPIERLLIEFSKKPATCKSTQIVIHDIEKNDYHEDYINLTKDFYLKF